MFRRAVLSFVLGLATIGCAIPSEDSLEVALVFAWAEHTWDNEMFDCESDVVYEVYPNGTFIGVVAAVECQDTTYPSIGIYIPADGGAVEAGTFEQ